MVDGSDFPQQGVHSVGVKRQYCGELGTRANCQAGVCVGSGSPQGYTVLARRLSVPTEWLTDDTYAERRRQCGLPAESTFTTQERVLGRTRSTEQVDNIGSHTYSGRHLSDSTAGRPALSWPS